MQMLREPHDNEFHAHQNDIRETFQNQRFRYS